MDDYILEKYGAASYIVAEYDEKERSDLVSEVNHLISNGYTPIGGISVRAGSLRGAYLMQAMVKAPIITPTLRSDEHDEV